MPRAAMTIRREAPISVMRANRPQRDGVGDRRAHDQDRLQDVGRSTPSCQAPRGR